MLKDDFLLNFFEDDVQKIKDKTGSLLKKMLDFVNESDYKELYELYISSKPIRYSAKGYLEESIVPEREKDILTNIGYTRALLDVMQLYTENGFEQNEIHRINTKYKFDVLKALAEKGTMLHKDLASVLGVSASGLTAVIQKMNSTSVKVVNVEEISKYKLYSLTAQAYKYYMQNKANEPGKNEKPKDQKIIIIYGDKENSLIEYKTKIEKHDYWSNESKARWKIEDNRRMEKYREKNIDIRHMEESSIRNRPA